MLVVNKLEKALTKDLNLHADKGRFGLPDGFFVLLPVVLSTAVAVFIVGTP